MHLRRTFADADRKHRAHPGLVGAAQHGLAVIVVARTVQMGVRIDQHWCSELSDDS